MSVKAKAIRTLYKTGRIGRDGVLRAVSDGIITADEYKAIIGEK